MAHTAWILLGEYSFTHFLVFALIGAVGGLMIDRSERNPELFAPLLIFTAGLEVFLIALLMLTGLAADAAMPWWKVILGNLMATLSITHKFFAEVVT
jgi:hypothetical protein